MFAFPADFTALRQSRCWCNVNTVGMNIEHTRAPRFGDPAALAW
jgi:hypothetical protein